ncbi:MAG: hypothetical protein N4A43_01980, partial [Alphaproteobacteria bacterium]|nr:hypothetical protein [Alphaproteobacteria bacterium]
MSNLIITILGIVLFVVLSVSGVMYVDSRSVSVRENEYLVKSGINQLVSDYHVYKVRRKEPLPVNNWSSFIEVPRTPANMSWSYGSKPEGMYFCLSGEIKDRYFYEDTIKILEDSFNSVVVSNTCGETSNNKNFMLGDTKAYTVWVDSSFISEGSDIENSNVYDFQVKMIEVETGKEIKLHDNLILHKGYDFLIDIEISDSSVKSTVEPVSDFEAEFICLDNSKGCNNGLKRRLRVKSTSLFMDRDLILDFENSKGKVRKIIHLKSIAAFQCDALDPLANFDKSGDFYLIGGTQGYKVDAKLQLLCLSQNQTPEVLSAKYRLMSNIDFDIKHNLTKTYQNVQAVENINQTENYPFIKSISSTVTSNGEDWNGDGSIDDINTEGWIPLGDFSNGSKQFSGEFDGNNHYIKNIYSKRTAGFQGLFGATHTNFKVYDLQILDSYIESSGDQIGLLSGEADGATISNCYVSGNLVGKISNYAGGLIGHVDASSKISNVHVHADVVVNSNASAYVGEVIGNLLNGSTLSQASANGDVFAKANTHAFVGGLVGGFATSLSNSYSLGSVYGYALNNYAMVGGISGWNTQNNLTIDNCYSKAHVGAYTSKSISSAGGLYGDDNLGGLIINNSYATGKVLSYSVDGPARAGGLAGGMNATNSEINNSYAYWEVAPNAYSVNSSKANGGLIGVSPAVINNANNICEYVSESTPTKCTKANIAYMQSSIKANWSDDIWEDLSNETPKLEWEVKGDVNSVFSWGCNPSNPLGGMEKEIVGIDEYYLIGGSMGSSARAKEHLLCLSQNQTSEVLNSNYKLTADITFDNDFSISKKYQDINNNISSTKDEKHPFLQNITVTLSSNNEDWDGDRVIDGLNTEGFIPLGNYADDSSNLFKGKFEGGNHSITNLYINRDSKNYQGLFGDIVGPGEVKNLNIVNAYIRGKDSIGILSGRLYSANVNNVKTDGHIKSRGSSGGIVGTMDSNAKISSSNSDVYIYSNEDADSQFIGGIVGSSFNSTLSNNKSSGDLLAIGSIADKYNWGGGITGYLRNTTVDGCSSSVNVFSANPTASHGFAGGISGGSYASSKILNSNSSGNVASVNSYVGGITGYSNSSSIENCHATGDIEGKIYYVGGLVGYAYNTVNLKNSYATGDVTGNNNYVGGAVGRAFKSNLENIYATGNVIGNGSYIGGMAGSLSNDSSASDCYAEGSVKNNKNYHTGGLIGGMSNNSTVSGCYSKGQVSTVNHYAGGLIGYANGSTISDSYSESIVLAPGKNYVGGLIGYANGATINSSYAVGNVLGAYNVGGLIGPIRGSTIKNTYAKGNVVGSSSNVGGLIGGFADSNTLENSYAIGDVVGSGYKNGALVGGLYSSSGSLIIKKSYAVNTSLTAIGDRVFDKYNYCSVGVDKDCDITYNPYSIKDAWDDNIWEDLFEEAPKLEWQEDGDISSGYAWSCNSADPLSNIDIDSGYYMIGSIKGNAALAKKQLVCLSNNQNSNVLSSNYKLTANIDFKENPSEEDWNGDDSPDGSSTNGWSPIGYNSSNRFVGAFDGQGHYIKNLYISSTADNKGLFGLVSGAIIKDLGLSNVNIKGRTNIGALAGHITKSTSSVSGVLAKGSISSSGNNTGGLIGNVNSGVSVLNSYSVTNISSTGSYVGGLVGKISNNSKIIDSYSLSIVSGDSIVGGLLGGSVASSSSQATITNSYA